MAWNENAWASQGLRAGAMLMVVALGLLLGGCDKCGDWFGISRSEAQGGLVSCRDTPPPQQH